MTKKIENTIPDDESLLKERVRIDLHEIWRNYNDSNEVLGFLDELRNYWYFRYLTELVRHSEECRDFMRQALRIDED